MQIIRWKQQQHQIIAHLLLVWMSTHQIYCIVERAIIKSVFRQRPTIYILMQHVQREAAYIVHIKILLLIRNIIISFRRNIIVIIISNWIIQISRTAVYLDIIADRLDRVTTKNMKLLVWEELLESSYKEVCHLLIILTSITASVFLTMNFMKGNKNFHIFLLFWIKNIEVTETFAILNGWNYSPLTLSLLFLSSIKSDWLKTCSTFLKVGYTSFVKDLYIISNFSIINFN